MADSATKQSPVQCVTCRQPVPESVEELHYFAQTAVKPEADDVETFLLELTDLTDYVEVLHILLCNVDKSALEENQLYACHRLGWHLAEEAKHRLDLAREAWRLHEGCLREAPAVSDQAHARKEG